MNEVLKAIKERRSIRKYKKEIPTDEEIKTIVDAGLQAPSGKNMQSGIILVVKDPEIREIFVKANRRIGGFADDVDPFYGAPVLLVVLEPKGGKNSKYDGALMMENMMLAAHSIGLGSIWINRAFEEFEEEEFQELLRKHGIKKDYEGVGHCAIGYIDGDLPDPHPIRDGRVYYID